MVTPDFHFRNRLNFYARSGGIPLQGYGVVTPSLRAASYYNNAHGRSGHSMRLLDWQPRENRVAAGFRPWTTHLRPQPACARCSSEGIDQGKDARTHNSSRKETITGNHWRSA